MNIPSKNALLNRDTLIQTIQSLCEMVNSLEESSAIVIANQPFPDAWLEASNMSELISIINSDSTATKGRIYLSTIHLDDLPAGMMQAEMKVEIQLDSSIEKVMLFTITSENVSPYHWEYTSAYGRTGAWRSFVPN